MKHRICMVLLFCVAVVLATGVTGCMKKQTAVEKMVAYMNEKYDDYFEYDAPYGGGPGAASVQIIVHSEKYPDASIWVEYYTENGEEVFADNYVSHKYEEQTREALQSFLEEIYQSPVKLSYSVGTKGTINSFSDDTTFEEYISDFSAGIGFRAFVFDTGSAISITENELRQAIKDSDFVFSGLIFVTDDAGNFETAFDLPAKSMASIPQMQVIMDAPHSLYRYEWR